MIYGSIAESLSSTNTRLSKRTGWSARGSCFAAYAPFGHWKTQALIAGLRCHGLIAPWIETQLVPTRSPGDIVILDNVGFHKSERAELLVKAKGAWLLFLPPYSPDLNPIEMAFSKLKALLRKRAAHSFDTITQAIGGIISLFSVDECKNFFKAAGYEVE
ncbi:transposase [Falsochrobactrum shanghaiense]|uniref:transposase n=1 Tax=Falsochrobactrum shanghaiense TaxID=2201899 RepID=UPI001FE1D0FE|nr:transposase [Falsochrobactrum shanghaiense]